MIIGKLINANSMEESFPGILELEFQGKVHKYYTPGEIDKMKQFIGDTFEFETQDVLLDSKYFKFIVNIDKRVEVNKIIEGGVLHAGKSMIEGLANFTYASKPAYGNYRYTQVTGHIFKVDTRESAKGAKWYELYIEDSVNKVNVVKIFDSELKEGVNKDLFLNTLITCDIEYTQTYGYRVDRLDHLQKVESDQEDTYRLIDNSRTYIKKVMESLNFKSKMLNLLDDKNLKVTFEKNQGRVIRKIAAATKYLTTVFDVKYFNELEKEQVVRAVLLYYIIPTLTKDNEDLDVRLQVLIYGASKDQLSKMDYNIFTGRENCNLVPLFNEAILFTDNYIN